LSKGVGFIYIGGDTEAEHRLIADSIEDCAISSISVLKDGVVPGCAYSFLKISAEAKYKGFEKFGQAIYEPRKKLLESMGLEETGSVYNFRTKKHMSPHESDIWESVSVVNESIRSAYSLIREFNNVQRTI
jgi:chaperonin GroEL (HSP60 family)